MLNIVSWCASKALEIGGFDRRILVSALPAFIPRCLRRSGGGLALMSRGYLKRIAAVSEINLKSV